PGRLDRLLRRLPLIVGQGHEAVLREITAGSPGLGPGPKELAKAGDGGQMLALHIDVEDPRARIGEVGDGLRTRRDSADGDAADPALILIEEAEAEHADSALILGNA